ncbi:TIR-like protein FxsC [Dactylosporangium sp. NBC_01737]|uniref:TIR-like protein FxsC n=1 Tax=Dactylosporangium sp. NBC_01737 TaxID=2975959 RepID=UPI002E165155|nr:TIR-like protein FxsC [Dactylosporangium sp. NBC_01737]
MGGDAENDQRAPVFFVSHARPGRLSSAGPPQERYRHVKRFFDDLTANVNELIGSSPGQVTGFIDVAEDGGVRWREQVLHAAGTCQVLVCLLSTDYLFRSEWCPREWSAFASRRVVRRDTRRPDGETAIVPVLWAPFLRPLPPVVAEVNRFTPTGLPDSSYNAMYQEYGILGLLRTGQDGVYDAVVWKLAMHIQRIHHFYEVEASVLSSVDGLRTTFGKEDG